MRLNELDRTLGRHAASDRPRSGWRRAAQHNRNKAFIRCHFSAYAEAHPEDLAISVQDLRMTFKTPGATKEVLQGVNLAIPHGTFHMLLGPNGCGKSTLLRVLAGLFRPDSGAVRMVAPYAFVFQNPDHQVVMPTVGADVAFGLGRYSLDERVVQAAVRHALAQVGLAGLEERPTSSLSGGQKQRVAIAGALAESPSVLLMDELTTFLDYEDQQNVIQCVQSIVKGTAADAVLGYHHSSNGSGGGGAAVRPDSGGSGTSSSSGGGGGGGSGRRRGVTALWVTHRLEELDYADYVSYMDGGRIVHSGTPQEMKAYMRRLGAHV